MFPTSSFSEKGVSCDTTTTQHNARPGVRGFEKFCNWMSMVIMLEMTKRRRIGAGERQSDENNLRLWECMIGADNVDFLAGVLSRLWLWRRKPALVKTSSQLIGHYIDRGQFAHHQCSNQHETTIPLSAMFA